ncbi:MAG: toxin [Myxococcaceae bacterium]|nr:toxin [Myxococcaceae bacterium]
MRTNLCICWLVSSAALLACCYAPTCPSGYRVRGGRCEAADASTPPSDGAAEGTQVMPDAASDGASPEAGATGTDASADAGSSSLCTEAADAGDRCAADATFACTTSCGSAGIGRCAASCRAECTPPEELCNYLDDDCDGSNDEGLRRFAPSAPGAGQAIRSWTFADGPHPLVLLQGAPPALDGAATELRVQRLRPDGTPEASAQVLMSASISSIEYTVASTGPSLVIVWGEQSASDPKRSELRARIVRRSDLTDVVAPRTIASGAAFAYPVVAAGSSNVLVVALTDAGIARVATDGALDGSTGVLSIPDSTAGRPHLLAVRGSSTWLIAHAITPSTGKLADLVLQRVEPSGSLVGGPVRVTDTPATHESGPWLADNGKGQVALTFTAGDTGALRFLLYQLSELGLPTVTPYVNVSMPAGLKPCAYEDCRSSAVTWAAGYWAVVHGSLLQEPERYEIQLRLLDEQGALAAGSLPKLVVDDAADPLMRGPDAALNDHGTLVIVAPNPRGDRYALWGCF